MSELSFLSNVTGRAVCAIANVAALVISLKRDLVHHLLSPEECEEAGLDDGSLDPTPAIIITRPLGLSPWRVDAWRDHIGGPEVCLNIDLLGWSAEVWYYGKGESMQSARAAYRARRASVQA